MPSAPFIVDSAGFARLTARAGEIFCADRRLPEQVFRSGFKDFAFLEFDVLLFREFWDVLADCARSCGDEDISVIVHEPDPEAYYFGNFQRYGVLDFERNATATEYKQAFLAEPENSPADALQYVASVISWSGSSREWGFWGERDFGVAIAAKRNANMSWPEVAGVSLFDLDTAVESFIAPNFEDEKIPQEFLAKLRRNFANARNKCDGVIAKSGDHA